MLIKQRLVIYIYFLSSFWYSIVWCLVLLFLVINGFKSISVILLHCNSFEEAALEHKYIDHYGQNQRRRSITPLPTYLKGMFLRTHVSKISSDFYRVLPISPCRKQWVEINPPKLNLFSMAIIFDVRRYIPTCKKSDAKITDIGSLGHFISRFLTVFKLG